MLHVQKDVLRVMPWLVLAAGELVPVHATDPFSDGFEYSNPLRPRYTNRTEDVGLDYRYYYALSLPGGNLPESDPYDRWMTSATLVNRPGGGLAGNSQALKIELDITDQKAANAHRAEVTRFTSLSHVLTRAYSTSVSVYAPNDGTFDTDSQGETVFQWYPQFDVYNYGEAYGHPPLHMYTYNGNWCIELKGTSQQVNTTGASVYSAYDVNKLVYQTAYEKGTWTDWTFNVLWSPTGYGQLQVYKDGVLKVNYHGEIGHTNTAQGDVAEKFGIYKWSWYDNPDLNNYDYRSLYFDNYSAREGAVDPTIHVYDGFRSSTSGWIGGYSSDQSLLASSHSGTVADDGTWSNSWSGYANMLSATAQGLDYRHNDMKLWTRQGGAGTASNTIRKGVARSIAAHESSQGDIYYSFLLDFSTLPTSNHEMLAGLGSSLTGNFPSANYISLLNVEAGGAVRLVVNGVQSNSLFVLDDQVHLFVARHQFDVNGEIDRTTLWVDPKIGGIDPGSANYTFESSGTLDMVDKFTVYHGPWSNDLFNGAYQLDEIRIGTTWASVTPAYRVVSDKLLVYDAASCSPNYTAAADLNLSYEYNQGQSITSSHNAQVTARSGQWVGAWTGNANMLQSNHDVANSLGYTDSAGRSLLTGKGYFSTTSSPSRYVVSRTIAPQTAAETDRIFYSFLIRFTDLSLLTGDRLLLGLAADPGSGSASLGYVSMLGVKEDARAYALTNGAWGSDSVALTENTTYLILGMLQWNVDGTQADRTKIWINPMLEGFDPQSNAALNRDKDALGSLEMIDRFSILHGWATGVWSGAYRLDEIRIGLTWQSVLPPMYLLDTTIINPEPSSFLILWPTLTAMAVARRHRQGRHDASFRATMVGASQPDIPG